MIKVLKEGMDVWLHFRRLAVEDLDRGVRKGGWRNLIGVHDIKLRNKPRVILESSTPNRVVIPSMIDCLSARQLELVMSLRDSSGSLVT
jgi:hypothetical protein